jgi:hypothetical protein
LGDEIGSKLKRKAERKGIEMRRCTLIKCLVVLCSIFVLSFFPNVSSGDSPQLTKGSFTLALDNGVTIGGMIVFEGRSYYRVLGHQSYGGGGPAQVTGMLRTDTTWLNMSLNYIPIQDDRCPVSCVEPFVIGGGMTYDAASMTWKGKYTIHRMTSTGWAETTGTWELTSSALPFPSLNGLKMEWLPE